MNVLSLFDGMSCGQIALNRIGIKPTKYYASELDKYAIKVTQANYPNTVQLGDVTKWREWNIDWASIDLLIGGSPCQGFSFAGKQLAFDDPRSKLFFVYVNILNYIKSVNPNVKFMLENVKMKKEFLRVISEHLGAEPIFINSALVSAQNRQRYYWCNWNVEQPEDKGVVLADVLEVDGKGFDANYHKGVDNHGQRTMVFLAGIEQGRRLHDGKNLSRNFRQGSRVYSVAGLAPALSAQPTGNQAGHNSLVGQSDGKTLSYRKLTPLECERLQTVPDNYTNHVSNTQRYKMLGNGWTVDVICHLFILMWLDRVFQCQ